ncbi:SpoIVB peptidase [Oscillibacter hominis]|uniref:SpoIVB peptidase n=1 Tax=Oscillibacter hominis TaxID=2763056 RepID=A0A7G9B265_9FIRM|nr:SpoIVB peptidase [Oscillibacter hominis]QNL43646.1 SpoIVB peptidase [Oscillibacter hominis]
MHEPQKNQRKRLRGGAAAFLSLLLFVSPLVVTAQAADVVKTLVPVGHTIGVKLFSRGVLVVELSDGPCPARSCGLKTGDLITKCNGTQIQSTEHMQALLQQNQDQELKLQVQRGNQILQMKTNAVQSEEGNWLLGAWIRDSMAGIGTMTFYDPESGTFGALGHGVTDMDTAQLMSLSSGSVMASTVKAVKRGEIGEAGELRGNFDLTEDLGPLYANTDCGVFGTIDGCTFATHEAMPAAKNSEVHTGQATILANVSGDTVEEYEVQITKIFDNSGDTRNMLVEVTDPALLAVTGGIVQGMSGSPILQDGKIVGAVTHVLLNDPTRGYGIFIQNMMQQAYGESTEEVS